MKTTPTSLPSLLARVLASDRVVQAFLALSVLAVLPIFSLQSIEEAAGYSATVLSPGILGLAAVIVVFDAKRRESRRQRRFWTLVGGALAALWLAGTLRLVPMASDGLGWPMLIDGLYLGFYLLLAIAALSPADRSPMGSRHLLWAELLGLSLTLLGALTYFVFVPSALASETYLSWLPSMYLFQAMDLLLLFLFFKLIRDTDSAPWRAVYSMLLGAVFGWAALDFFEILHIAGWVDLPAAGLFDAFWCLPIATVVAASRASGYVARASQAEGTVTRVAPRLANVALVGTIAFPLGHLLLSSFGLVDPSLRLAREVVVLVWVVALGMVAYFERVEGQKVRWREQRRREEAEQALRESETRYRQLVEHAPEAIVILDPQTGRFVDANSRAVEMLKVDREELLELGPVDFSPEFQPDGARSADAAPEYIRRSLEGENPSFEWVHRDSRGEDIYCEVFLSSYPWGGRDLVRGSMIDVTDKVALREQLRQTQRMESIGQLAGGVAHDFNNLLTVITGYCDLALGRPGLDPGLRRDIEEVRSAGDSASALTSQLLAFSRRQVLRLEPVDLNSVVEGMREMLGRLVGEDQRLEVKLAPDMRRILADEGQVEQTLMNLAANARDAMPSGGLISLETEVIEVVEDEMATAAEPGLYGRLTVSDTGSGMDAATRERVFEPFFTTKSLGHGTGLGLATVYGIVAQSGGFIEVESTPGKGSKFLVHFPLAGEREVATRPATRPAREGSSGAETVLLVEDEKAVRDFLYAGLDGLGYRVLTAADGEGAIETVGRLGDAELDVVVCDVVLPGKNGPDVVREIRRVRPDVAVVFISGYTDDLLARKGEIAKGDLFLQKPFTASRLAEEIRSALRGAQAPTA